VLATEGKEYGKFESMLNSRMVNCNYTSKSWRKILKIILFRKFRPSQFRWEVWRSTPRRLCCPLG
jgi:hypothetical protein